MNKAKPEHFVVDPSVVYQLGESLITDAVQALIELVKNCYDADATYAKVTIDTQGVIDVDGSNYPSDHGRIIVEDDGHGMSKDDIVSGWLRISSRKKRDLKQAKQTTPGGRTPLGDKGLGRLGVQRLGENLEIITKSKTEPGYRFGFSWLEFSRASKLEDVKIPIVNGNYPRPHGTTVVVSGLRDRDIWSKDKELGRLEKELSQMISPYSQIRDFTVVVEVDGKKLELREFSNRIRDIAPVRYKLDYDGSQLEIKGRAKLDFFRPQGQKEADEFALLVESDGGQTFIDFLLTLKKAKSIGLARSNSKQWFVEFSREVTLAELDRVLQAPSGDGDIADPGPFTGEVDSFDLGSAAFQVQSVFDRISEYRKHIKELHGIRVYRDGFAIRVDKDWLKLGSQWTSAPSYYGLKPENTVGYIALSARENMKLEEKTDREGFRETPYYRNFYLLLEEFKRFTMQAHEFLGRSIVEFRKEQNEVLAKVDSCKSIEDISRTIKKGLSEAPEHQKNLDVFKARLSTSSSESKAVISRLRSAEDITPKLREKVTELLSDIEPIYVKATEAIDQQAAYHDRLALLQSKTQVIEDRTASMKRQMEDMYEAIALGLTAEALSHEIYNIADQLARRAKTAQTSLRKKGITDRTVLTLIEYVHSSVMALRKQMSFLAPSLKYVREQRADFEISEFLAELLEFYHDRLQKSRIVIQLLCPDKTPFVVRMNRGKLTQVIDNLVLNSEYWLKEDIVQKRLATGTIVLEVSRPFIRMHDDGRGIDPSVEDAIFEPFVSAKARGQGRGLGLFITKQLLDSEGCNIGLLPERNKRKRFFKFQIDLRGALHE